MQDKKSAGVMVITNDIKDKKTGELCATCTTSLFIRGVGGFGHKGTYKNAYPAAPKRAPDFEKVEYVPVN